MVRRGKGHVVLLGIAVLLAAAGFPALADQQIVEEYKVKAAFLFNFTKFVEWPGTAFANPSDPFVIAVLGNDPFQEALDILKGKAVKQRPIVVLRVAELGDLKSCHLLFVSSSERSRLASILPAAHKMNALTVGDAQGFGEKGVAVQFLIEEKRVRFAVNMGASREAGLKISSKLLSLATTVSGQK